MACNLLLIRAVSALGRIQRQGSRVRVPPTTPIVQRPAKAGGALPPPYKRNRVVVRFLPKERKFHIARLRVAGGKARRRLRERKCANFFTHTLNSENPELAEALRNARVQELFRLFPGATRFLSLLVLVAFFFAEAPLFAASLYWDINGGTSGSSGSTVVSGTWNASNAFWNTDSTGASGGTFTAVTSSSDDLFFSAGTNGTGTSIITLSGAQSANSLTFNYGTITLAGTLTPSLTLGVGGLTMASTLGGALLFGSTLTSVVLAGSQSWTNYSSQALTLSSSTAISGNGTAGTTYVWTIGGPGSGIPTISGVISNGTSGGTLAFTKAGPATLTLNPTSVNAYTGATTIRQGALALSFGSLGVNASDLINANSALVLGDSIAGTGGWTHPTLTVTGSTAQTNSQTFASTTVFSARNAQITAGTQSPGTVTINLGTITAGSYATLNLTNPNTASGTITAGNIITPSGTLTAGSVNASGMLGTWLTTGTSGTQGTDWVTRSGTSPGPETGYAG